jgi:hypothetical protein
VVVGADIIYNKEAMISHYQQQQLFNNTYIDAELLYEKRSKSVVKRREELIKKKEEDGRTKIQAKY